MILINLLIWLIAITVAITVHEFAHALISDRLGDPTARLKNRLSLNPLAHYDQVGTTMLIISAVMNAIGSAAGISTPVFGWAKAVEIDSYNLRNPRRDTALIALAGPLTNLITAFLLSLLLKNFLTEIPLMSYSVYPIIRVNIWLAIFNLIPISPLDGNHILKAILPEDLAHEYEIIMHRFGLFILIFLILPLKDGISPLNALISPAFNFILSLLR